MPSVSSVSRSPVSAAANIVFDLAEQPQRTLPGVPTAAEQVRFFSQYLFYEDMLRQNPTLASMNSNELDRELTRIWGTLTPVQQASYEDTARTRIQGLFTQTDATRMFQYLERRKSEVNVMFGIGLISNASNITASILSTNTVTVQQGSIQYQAPAQAGLVDILSQRYIGFNGELNIPQVMSLMMQGQGFEIRSGNQLFGGNASAADRIFSVFGATVDLRSFANEMFGDGALDRPFLTAPSRTRFNLYIFVYPLGLNWEIDLVRNLIGINNNPDISAYEVVDGRLKSRAVAYES